MVKTLHFDILVKEDAFNRPDIGRLKSLWPAYQNNIHVVNVSTGISHNVMVKACLFEGGHSVAGASRAVTCNEFAIAGSFDDAIDFVMEELLNLINKTQDTQFTRGVSCIYTYLPNNPMHNTAVDSLTSAFESCSSSRSKYKTWYKQYIDIPELKRVHSSGPVSVAIWSNDKKSMVRKQKGDKSDPEKGILYAVIKGLCYEKGGTKEYSRVLDMIHEALEERKNG